MHLWDSLGLLTSSVGACSGGTIIDYCRLNKLNAEIFDELTINYSENKFILQSIVPHDLEDYHITRLTNLLINCPITSYIKSEIEVNITKSEKTIKEVKPRKRGCCGG